MANDKTGIPKTQAEAIKYKQGRQTKGAATQAGKDKNTGTKTKGRPGY